MSFKAKNANKQVKSRRKFIKSGSVALAAVAGGGISAAALSKADGFDKTANKRFGILIDLDRCIGCRSCAVACKSENGVRLGGFRSWVSEMEDGLYPRVTRYFLPRLCNHCLEPACQKVCPVGATFKRPDGLVDIDKSRCIGCRYCMVACPYGVRYFNPGRDSEGEQLFPARTMGTVDKCNLCAHRVDNSVVPACVNTCPASARIFGDLNDPESDIYGTRETHRPSPLLPEFGTGPSVFYKGGNLALFKNDKGDDKSRILNDGSA
jgi:tetrathionate reductase subunit B